MNRIRRLFRKREPKEPRIFERAIRVESNWDCSGGKVILIHGNTNTELNIPVTKFELVMEAGKPVTVNMGILCGGLDLIQELTEENPLIIEVKHLKIEVDHNPATSENPPPWACECEEKNNA